MKNSSGQSKSIGISGDTLKFEENTLISIGKVQRKLKKVMINSLGNTGGINSTCETQLFSWKTQNVISRLILFYLSIQSQQQALKHGKQNMEIYCGTTKLFLTSSVITVSQLRIYVVKFFVYLLIEHKKCVFCNPYTSYQFLSARTTFLLKITFSVNGHEN